MKNLKTANFYLSVQPLFSLLCILFLSFVSLSCSLFFSTDNEKFISREDQNNASFIVEEVVGRVEATRVNGLPEEIRVSYKTCFRDFNHPDNTLQNSLFKIHLFENFQVRGDNKDQKKVNLGNKPSDKKCSESPSFLLSSKESCIQIRTDSSGCLNWTEIYPYYPVNQSVWLHYKRAFEGTGANSGVTTIPMAVNPWLSLDPSGSAEEIQLVDLSYHSIDKGKILINMEEREKEVLECQSCAVDKDKINCNICENKKRSLSFAINYFAKKAVPPQLWLNELRSTISQENILINDENLPEEHLKTLNQFKVCHKDVKTECDPPGRFFRVRLQMPLRIQVKNYRNELELLPLTHGSYSIKTYLFLKNDKGKNIILHRDMGFISTELVKGSRESILNAEFHFHVPYENYGLPAYLGLRIQPEGKGFNSSFIPFEGVFAFPNQLRSVIGSNTLNLEREVFSFYEKNQFKDVSILKSYRFSGSWENQKGEGFRRAGWDVRLKRLRFSDISIANNQCPTPVDRTVRYVGEVCIIDPLTNAPVPNTQINIQRQNIFFTRDGQSREGEVTEIPEMNSDQLSEVSQFKEGTQLFLGNEKSDDYDVSDTSGCLQWMDQIYHKWYNREHYFVRKMIFSKKEWGFEGERMIAINPWHWGFVFFQDVTQLDHNNSVKTVVVAKRAEEPKIILHDFRSLYPDLIYAIDRWLGINVFQNLLFLFRVRIDRPDNSASGQGGQRPSSMDIRRGYYFLRFILVKSHTEEDGGRGNQAVNLHSFEDEYYNDTKTWNANIGWKTGRDGSNIGQMMHTNLDYITHSDTPVRIRDSVVNAYANFLFDLDEFVFIGSNNRLIIQVLPTDPQYYAYKKDSCEVDLDNSSFVPFPEEEHELVNRPFMGTFVPGDQRNWNIFKILDKSVELDLDFMSLDMTPQQIEDFIEMEKKNSVEHELFIKLQSSMVVRTGRWSKRSQEIIKNIGSITEKLYDNLYQFLNSELTPGALSDFDQKKNQLLESIDESIFFISTALNGYYSKDEQDRKFLGELKTQLNEAFSILNNPNNSDTFLQEKLEEFRKRFITLTNNNLSRSLSDIKRDALLQQKQQKSVFAESIFFPTDPKEWSGFNMNMFAKNEGLKVLTMNDDTSIETFLDDLNDTAKNHNKYHFAVKNYHRRNNRRLTNEMINEMIQSRDKNFNELNEESYAEFLKDHQEMSSAFWNNFELIDGDNYHAIDKKIRQMYLPKVSKSWLNTVLFRGIHSGTISTPEVMSFLHSLCGFWFDKFYNKYLEQRQLDTIFKNHMEHFDYYKKILEYLSEEGAREQYMALNEAMKQYNLIQMDESFLTVRNPFIKYDINVESPYFWENWSSEEEDNVDVDQYTVSQSFYKGMRFVLEHAGKTNAIANVSMVPSTQIFMQMLNSYRHPYFKCIANPFNFFHLEKKIIVGDIGDGYSDLKYEYGVTKSFNVQRAFDYAYSATWSMSRAFSTSFGTGVAGLGFDPTQFGGAAGRFLSPLKVISPLFSFAGIRLASDWTSSRSKSDQNRRQQSLRFADESLYLQTQHSAISIRLKNYRHCLIVRAANLSFEGYKEETVWLKELDENFIHKIPYIKSGLMICSDDIDAENEKEPFFITEDYFYFYQNTPGDRGQFHNALSYRNRPFIASIRGITEMEKFTFHIHSSVEADKEHGIEDYDPFGLMTNPYNTISNPVVGTKEAVYWTKTWDKTGFYPGVYNVKYDNEHYYFSYPDEREKGLIGRTADWFHNNNPFDFIRFDKTEALSDRKSKQ